MQGRGESTAEDGYGAPETEETLVVEEKGCDQVGTSAKQSFEVPDIGLVHGDVYPELVLAEVQPPEPVHVDPEEPEPTIVPPEVSELPEEPLIVPPEVSEFPESEPQAPEPKGIEEPDPIKEVKEEPIKTPPVDTPEEPPLVLRTEQWKLRDKPGRGRGRGRGRGGGRGKGKPSENEVVEIDSQDEGCQDADKQRTKRTPRAKSKVVKDKTRIKKTTASKTKESAISREDDEDKTKATEIKVVWGPVTKEGLEHFRSAATFPTPLQAETEVGADDPKKRKSGSSPLEPVEGDEGENGVVRKRAKPGEGIAPSFARRPCPKSIPYTQRWEKIKSTYDEIIAPWIVSMGFPKASYEAGVLEMIFL